MSKKLRKTEKVREVIAILAKEVKLAPKIFEKKCTAGILSLTIEMFGNTFLSLYSGRLFAGRTSKNHKQTSKKERKK